MKEIMPCHWLLSGQLVTFAECIFHTGCLFLEHLSGVQDVLRSWDEPEYVCNTGLFHSVYGTELFQVLYVLHVPYRTVTPFALSSVRPRIITTVVRAVLRPQVCAMMQLCSRQLSADPSTEYFSLTSPRTLLLTLTSKISFRTQHNMQPTGPQGCMSASILFVPVHIPQDYSVSFDRRPDIQALIGHQAEFLVHTFCIMDLASLDATMDAPSGKHHVVARKQHGTEQVPLTDQQYHDLITVQLADWLEQVHSWADCALTCIQACWKMSCVVSHELHWYSLQNIQVRCCDFGQSPEANVTTHWSVRVPCRG